MSSGRRLLRPASESLEPPVANDGLNFVSQRGFEWPLWRFWLQRSSEHAASAKRCCDSNSCVGKWPESPHYVRLPTTRFCTCNECRQCGLHPQHLEARAKVRKGFSADAVRHWTLGYCIVEN